MRRESTFKFIVYIDKVNKVGKTDKQMCYVHVCGRCTIFTSLALFFVSKRDNVIMLCCSIIDVYANMINNVSVRENFVRIYRGFERQRYRLRYFVRVYAIIHGKSKVSRARFILRPVSSHFISWDSDRIRVFSFVLSGIEFPKVK